MLGRGCHQGILLLEHAGEHLLHVGVLISDLAHHVVEDLVLRANALHLGQEVPLVILQLAELLVHSLILSPLALLTRPLGDEDS
jgi:hypothetical protein